MSGCPTVHHHDEFSKSFDPSNQRLKNAVKNTTAYLKSDACETVGEKLRGDLSGFKSHPRGQVSERVYFILCQDCKAELLKRKCSFCKTDIHKMDDAVLFFAASDHIEQKKEINKLASEYKSD